jgi:hypothetical protein
MDALKPRWNYFLQFLETLFGSFKDENKILKKDQGKSFKTFYYPDPAYLKKKLKNCPTLVLT